MAFKKILVEMLPLATAATTTTSGIAGAVPLAADSDTTSRDKAATPANVKQQITNLSSSLDTSKIAATTKLNTKVPIEGGGLLKDELTISIKDASTSNSGVTQLATNAEALAGTLTTKAITPANLKALRTEITKEIDTEIGNSVPKTRNIKTTLPLEGGATLANDINLSVKDATTSSTGVIRLATNAEATAGSATNLAISPATLKTVVDAKIGSIDTDTGGAPIPQEGSGIGQWRTMPAPTYAGSAHYDIVLPAGGTWAYQLIMYVEASESGATSVILKTGVEAGGTAIYRTTNVGIIHNGYGFCWRVS